MPGSPLTVAAWYVTPCFSTHRAPADERLRDAQCTDERLADGRRLPAAVSVQRRVGREHRDQRIRVAGLPGFEEASGDLLALRARDVEASPPFVDVRVRTREDLPGVRLRLADDPGDLVVRVVEDLAQEEHRTLDGRELLEQVKERERQRIRHLGVLRCILLGQRLGQPLARIDLALAPR